MIRYISLLLFSGLIIPFYISLPVKVFYISKQPQINISSSPKNGFSIIKNIVIPFLLH